MCLCQYLNYLQVVFSKVLKRAARVDEPAGVSRIKRKEVPTAVAAVRSSDCGDAAIGGAGGSSESSGCGGGNDCDSPRFSSPPPPPNSYPSGFMALLTLDTGHCSVGSS
jgi:hypothetical protein